MAILVLLLLHTPPGVASPRGDIRPTQADGVPVMAAVSGFTNIEVDVMQPVGSV